MGGLTIEIIFFILKIEKRNKIIVFDFQKVGAGAQKSGGAAALPAPPPPRSLTCTCILIFHLIYFIEKILFKAVIKRQGLGFPPATKNVAPGNFRGKVEEK